MKFNHPYSRSEFIGFLKRFLPEDTQLNKQEKVLLTGKMNYARSVVRLGKCESFELSVYEIRHASKHDARVGLSRDAFRIVADEGVS